MAQLLASAPSLDSIGGAIRDFYCGETKPLVEQSPGVWAVTRADGSVIPSVRVIRKGKRFRFETV